MASKPIPLFYFIQNEKGDEPSHPNVAKVFPKAAGKVTLQDVMDCVALPGLYHFRFKVTVEKQTMFLDLCNPEDSVPMEGGSIFAKVLRLDQLKTVSKRGLILRTKDSFPALPAAGQQASSARSAEAVSDPSKRVAASSSAAAAGGAGAGRMAAPAAPPLAAPTPHEPEEEPFTEEELAVDLSQVDEDLRGKSEYVQRKVMARRIKLRKQQQARVDEAAALARAAKKDQEDIDAVRASKGALLKAWAEEPSGAKKSLRVLLAGLQEVLWEGHGWEPVPMAKLIEGSRVKRVYFKAVTLVHPDKQLGTDAVHKYVAATIYDYLKNAYTVWQETEGAGI